MTIKKGGKQPRAPSGRTGDSKRSTASGEIINTAKSTSPRSMDSMRPELEVRERKVDPDAIDFRLDKPEEMTMGRRIALSLMKQSWYNPGVNGSPEEQKAAKRESKKLKGEEVTNADEDDDDLGPDGERTVAEVPSIEKAWIYFEHVALSRYICRDKPKAKKSLPIRMMRKFAKGNKKLERAEPGERNLKTQLYSPIWTPHSQLGDFGLGIGLYFSTLRAIALITLIAGCVSIPNILYFNSDEYMPAQFKTGLPTLVLGSALCLNNPWVPCIDCNCSDDKEWEQAGRCGSMVDEEGTLQAFAKRNACNGPTKKNGMFNYATMLMFLVSTVLLSEFLQRQEVKFDEDEQTAQDYSIVITNPPDDAKNPDEWRRFFKDKLGATVTVCTCALDNDLLVRTLQERREKFQMLKNMLKPGTSTNLLHIAKLAAKEERSRNALGQWMASFSPGIPELFARIVTLNSKVQGLAQLSYPCTNVFITFETEKDQRKVLSNMSVSYFAAGRNDKSALATPDYLFRGEHVLAISEPEEPNTIRWQDLNTTFKDRMRQQGLTLFATLTAIAVVALVVNIVNESDAVLAAFVVSGANSIFPMFAKALTNMEAHASEGHKQTSLYIKIAFFRWVNTAIVITIIKPFTATLDQTDGLITQIAALYLAEIVTTNLIQLSDPMGHINRHFFAPRDATQDAMNLRFQGERVELAERYTNMTKVLFLTLWYCSIYPAAFFLGGCTMYLNYLADRFSLMRTWKRPPQLGSTVSKVSRRYFFNMAIVAMAVMSSFYWSGFPYDNLCPAIEGGGQSVIEPGNYTIRFRGNGTTDGIEGLGPPTTVEVLDGTPYRFCNQNLLKLGGGFTFPFIAAMQPEGGEWMTEDQEFVTTIYGVSSMGVIAIVIAMFCYGWIQECITLFTSSHSAVGDDQGTNFSDVETISAYVPQVESSVFSYPLLAVNVDAIDQELFDWTDPDRDHSFYDLTRDAFTLLKGLNVSSKTGFSIMKHWPPVTKTRTRENSFASELGSEFDKFEDAVAY